MTTIAVMQPHYLAWAGYFQLLQQADHFVFLDDVQFTPRSWQCRNRILRQNRPQWLTVPVKKASGTLIRDVAIDANGRWRQSHTDSVRHTYGKHPAGGTIIDVVTDVLAQEHTLLCELNVSMTQAICSVMGLKASTSRSTTLSVSGRKSSRLLAICQALDADVYLSAAGSREYIEAEGSFAQAGLPVRYQNFEAPPYAQLGTTEFISHLSIVDVIANLGPEGARNYIRVCP